MSKIFDLTGKVAMITGASSGLGLQFARTLAAQGAAVAVTARRRERLSALVAELQGAGGKAVAIAMDVISGDSIRAGYDDAEGALGPIDVVVNNAGISIVKPALEMPEADWDEVVNTNLRGAWLVAQSAAQRMVAAKRPGRIINVASILALRTIGQVAPYNAAKAGLLHLTRVLAMEWARHGIQVNAISPGYIETEMNDAFWRTDPGKRLIERVPQRRLGKPAELDGALLLLASDAGAFMTGANIVVDGGHTVNSL
ncbi:MAG TPA: glucose 1-dehydrogenase [Vineibacter sp.]|nr:glucose 1-dehydrogenase [Vineibacter sp.]